MMNKKVMALAVAGALAAPTTVLAQNAVTISGKINMGIESVSGSGQSFTPSAANAGGIAADNARFAAAQGAMTSKLRSHSQSSHLVVRVAEDLGGGNKFAAAVPIYFCPDALAVTTSCGGAGFGDTYIDLSGGWGGLRFGKLAVHYTSHLATVDNFYTDTNVNMSVGAVYSAGIGGVGTTSGYATNITGRTNSYLQYSLPKIANALSIKFGAQVNSFSDRSGLPNNFNNGQAPVQNAGAVLGTNSTNDNKNPRAYNITMEYAQGPLSGVYSYMTYTNQAFNGNQLQFSTVGNNHSADALRTAPNSAGGVGGGQIFTIATASNAGGTAGFTCVNFGAAAISGNSTIKGHRFGFKYDFGGGFKAGFVMDKSSNDVTFQTTIASFSTSTGAASAVTAAALGSDNYSVSRTAWHIPLFFTSGKNEFYAAYLKSGQLNFGGTVWNNAVAAGASGSQTGVKQYMLGYKYSLSSRTKLTANFIRISNEDRSGIDLRTNSTGMTTINRGADLNSLSASVVHTF